MPDTILVGQEEVLEALKPHFFLYRRGPANADLLAARLVQCDLSKNTSKIGVNNLQDEHRRASQ